MHNIGSVKTKDYSPCALTFSNDPGTFVACTTDHKATVYSHNNT